MDRVSFTEFIVGVCFSKVPIWDCWSRLCQDSICYLCLQIGILLFARFSHSLSLSLSVSLTLQCLSQCRSQRLSQRLSQRKRLRKMRKKSLLLLILMSYSSVNVHSCIIKIIFFIKLNGGNIIYKRLIF